MLKKVFGSAVFGVETTTISGVETFQIPNPVSYITSFFGDETDCN